MKKIFLTYFLLFSVATSSVKCVFHQSPENTLNENKNYSSWNTADHSSVLFDWLAELAFEPEEENENDDEKHSSDHWYSQFAKWQSYLSSEIMAAGLKQFDLYIHNQQKNYLRYNQLLI